MRSSWLRLQFQSGASWKTARRVEARRVQKLRKEKETTNPYHRAQYISAYVESRSADFAHRSMVQQRAPAVSLPAHPTLLQLADSLEKQYGTGASLAKSPQVPHESRVARPPSSSADVVAFGAWRSSATNTDASSSAVLPHCILRDAKTPPGLSTEVLRRRVAWHSPPVKAFCIMLNQKEDVDAANVLGAARRLYVKLEVPRRSANVEDRLRHGCNLASCMLDEMVPRMGWVPCVEFLRWYVQRISREYRATPSTTTTTTASSLLFTPMSAVSQVVAVMAESLRYHHPQLSSSSYPSLEDLELLCVELCSIIANGLTQSQPTTLLPVVAAPLLSIIHLSRDTNTAPSVDAVLRFGATHLEQRGKRRYLPSLAWGELIRAADRCGASHTDLQHLVDRITDPAQTKHAERLLRDPHVWSAYLACSPAKHAISIYAENRAHYKVAESSELVAAMMMAHLRSGEGEEAVKVWRKHQRPQPGGRPAPSITTSIAVALVRAHALTHNRNALLRMCADYPGLWHTFAGATVAETWASLNGPALLQKAEVAAREAKTVQSGAYLDHLRAMCRATREWEFPPVIVAALHEAIAALDAPGATTPTSVPELTTDAVADLMM